ncbi:restriction endonuclease subunit S [Vibrio crassostreae]|uniref:restriction endonuclease subunit S n=1 Tax=Vibrio crassostreae TaxID=246167 RepID=UPI000F476471|nr:restriction endonuclease subunit S [Vibrio crassostreae]ROR88514.1 type I restriction enzyme S subunit [Vibrio crassostreae]
MVPNGWEVKPLSSITKWSSGGTPSKNNPDYWSGEIPWISAASMRGHYFNKSELKITDLAVSNGAKMAPKDSLLLLVRGSMLWNKIPVGIAARRVSFNQDVKCLIPHADELTTEFLLYWFLTYEHRLMNMVTGTGIGAGKLDTTDLQGLDVFLPQLAEQRKIAQILTTWDKAIATTEKLIETSKQQKKALMQQLLTGKKRLVNPETGKVFEGEWEEVRLDDLALYRRGSFPQPYGNPEWVDKINGYPFIQVFDIDKNMKLKSSTKTKISDAAIGKSVFIKAGTVIVSLQGSIGRVAITQYDAYVDRTVLLFQQFKRQMDTVYFAYAVQELFEIEKEKAPGGTIKTITKQVLSNFTINVPIYTEQQKIASVLTAADKEVVVLQAKLVHFKQEKKALMQQLLTGKRRVKVAETESA